MVASITDKFNKTGDGSGVYPITATVTTGRSVGASTLACDDLSGWAKDTAVHFTTYRLNSDGTVNSSTQTDWKGVVSGNTITNLTFQAGAADTGNLSGDKVEMSPNVGWANDLMDGLLASHNQNGTLKDGSVTSAKLASNAVTNSNIADNSINSTKIKDFFKIIYPVGSVYMTANNTFNPTATFGGTWEKIEGKFLRASDASHAIGSTGGTEKHQHKYGIQYAEFWDNLNFAGNGSSHGLYTWDGSGNRTVMSQSNVGNAGANFNGSTQQARASYTAAHYGMEASTSPESNIPPYVVVNIWKRTA